MTSFCNACLFSYIDFEVENQLKKFTLVERMNSRRAEVGRDLWRSCSPAPLFGQPVPVHCHPHGKEMPSKKSSPSLLFTLVYYISKSNAMICELSMYTVTGEFPEDMLCAQDVHHTWEWFCWRSWQTEQNSCMLCSRPCNGLQAK